jgi:acetate kinase
VNILVVNAGSSTLKLSRLDASDTLVSSTVIDGWDGEADVDGLRSFLEGAAVDVVGHRVVHGGTEFAGPVVVDGGVEARIHALSSLAPLHQPRALAGIRAVRQVLPGTLEVAAFDTSFHATMPAAASTYALPAEWNRRWGLRRYGFHGLSHAYAARRAAEMLDRPPTGLRVVTCHLGSGASLCAVVDGRSVDTTMGFTPVEGVVMGTRSGTVDPGLIAWLLDTGGIPAAEMSAALEQRSGLAGLAGTADMREVLERAAAGDAVARSAVETYVHRLVRELAGMAASAHGCDALVFTGGVGEHAPAIRAAAAHRLAFLGVALDDAANAAASADVDISRAGAAVRTLVVTAREDLEISRQVRAVASALLA